MQVLSPYFVFLLFFSNKHAVIQLKYDFTLFIYLFSLLAAALSAEEDRLWKIVTANSSDFSSWTALIEETEKVAEVCYIIT